MPEHAEFVGNTLTANGTYIYSGDYTWPAQSFDAKTPDQKTQTAIADLQTAIAVLTNEVQHLREDIARMKAGESEL